METYWFNVYICLMFSRIWMHILYIIPYFHTSTKKVWKWVGRWSAIQTWTKIEYSVTHLKIGRMAIASIIRINIRRSKNVWIRNKTIRWYAVNPRIFLIDQIKYSTSIRCKDIILLFPIYVNIECGSFTSFDDITIGFIVKW